MDYFASTPKLVKAWKGLVNRPEWVRLNTDLLGKIANKSDDFITRVDGFYSGLINNLPSNLPRPIPSSMPFSFNGQNITLHFNKFGLPKFGPHMTKITHNGSNAAKSYKGTWNPVTSSHGAARTKDLKDATNWALETDAAGNLVNFPNGRVRRATTAGGNPSQTKIEILKDGGNPANDADWIEQTWHHHENGVDIIPVPTALHNHVSHSGGFVAKHGSDGSTITPDTDITEIFDYSPEIN